MSSNYADLHDAEVTGTQGQPAETVWIGSGEWWKKVREWLRGESCPHPSLHVALVEIALDLTCPARPEPGLNSLLDAVFEGKQPPKAYWGDKL